MPPRIRISLLLCSVFATPAVAEDALFPFVVSYDAPDNATNVSDWLPRPAGAAGFIRAERGHLANDAGPIRFWATNFCFDACFPSHEQAERVAARLARLGINCVRMHHMDNRSIWGDSPDRLTIDPARLERLDYLIYQLKQHGIYTNLNLHVSRTFGPAEGFPDPEARPKYDKGLDNFERRMIQLQRKYACDLLTHDNPYTGTVYADEPAIAFVEINNENALFNSWSRRELDDLPDPYAITFRRLWNGWLRDKYGTTARLKQVWKVGSQPLGDELLKNGDFSQQSPAAWNLERDEATEVEWSVTGDGPDGKAALKIQVTRQGREPWRPQLSQSGFAVKKDAPYTLTCYLRSDAQRKIGVNCMMAHEPWQRLGFTAEAEVTPQWKPYRWTFVATQDDEAARLTWTSLVPGVYELAGVSLRPGGIVGLEEDQRLEDDNVPVLKRGEMNLTETARHDFIDFLWDTEQKYWSGMYRYLKDTLGVRPIVSGTQLSYSPVTIQAQLDYIDAHSYWHHPRFPGRPWDSQNWYVNNAALVNSPGGTLAGLAARRVQGLPFTVSEYNHPRPIAYAAEGFPMIAAMGAFQDWDGIFSFAYCHNADFEPRRISSYFDIKADSAKLVHMPACAALFLRRDVTPARETLVASVSPQGERQKLHETGDPWQLTAERFGVPSEAALRHAIAIGLASDESTPPAAPPAAATAGAASTGAGARVFVSDTGQLRWDASEPDAGYFAADTPRSKLFTGFVRGRKFSLGQVQLDLGPTRLDWATVSLVCLDGAGFDQPGRILIAATGWTQNRGAELESLGGGRVTLRNRWGDEPVLCEGIPASITLPVAAERVKFYALDERGERRSDAAVAPQDGQAVLRLAPEHQTLWYEAEIQKGS